MDLLIILSSLFDLSFVFSDGLLMFAYPIVT